jgi:prophage maintenance system killer protein
MKRRVEAALARPRVTLGGAAAAEPFLNVNGVDLVSGDEELVLITLAVARGEVSAEALAIWLRQRSRRIEP